MKSYARWSYFSGRIQLAHLHVIFALCAQIDFLSNHAQYHETSSSHYKVRQPSAQDVYRVTAWTARSVRFESLEAWLAVRRPSIFISNGRPMHPRGLGLRKQDNLPCICGVWHVYRHPCLRRSPHTRMTTEGRPFDCHDSDCAPSHCGVLVCGESRSS